jgi:photosystem II stability/assembly factor-like uncharacterized protein
MLQVPEKPADVTQPIVDDVEAGVIHDARRRQQHQRRVTAAMIIAGLAIAGLIVGFGGGGGGGSGVAHDGHGHGPSPSATPHAASQVVPTIGRVPPNIDAFGLLAPRVGWVANGVGFYMTHDGGRTWVAVSRDTQNGNRYGHVAVPGLGLSGDIGPSITASASPTPTTLVLAFDDGKAFKPCHTTPSVGGGAVTITTDSGRTWQTHIMPGCVLPESLSFTTALTGFALIPNSQGAPASLYKTTDGGRAWRRLGDLPITGRIDFTGPQDGWLLGRTLYHTTDGGRTWTQASVCRRPASRLGVQCQLVRFYGHDGVVLAVAHNSSVQPLGTRLYTTRDDGRTWSTHKLGPFHELRHYGMAALFTPNAHDIFVSFSGGLLARSTDGGRTWTRMPAPKFSGMLSTDLDFVNASYGWAQSGRHFDYTTDGGRHWKPVGRQRP